MSDYNLSGLGRPEYDTDNGLRPLPSSKPQLKPIPTNYRGCIFRSRLEARWAVFFDNLGVEWRYEHQGYILAPFGIWYLPDFYLPELGAWVEVKATYPDECAQRKTYLFDQGLVSAEDPVKSCERAYVLHGDIPFPYPKEGNIIGYDAGRQKPSNGSSTEDEWGTVPDLCWQVCPMCQQIRIAPIDTMPCGDCIGELGSLIDDALDVVEGIPHLDRIFDIVPAATSGLASTEFFRSGFKTHRLREAYAAARAARFGERRYRTTA